MITLWADAPRHTLKNGGAGATQMSASNKEFSGSFWVAGLLFRKLTVFWVFRTFDD